MSIISLRNTIKGPVGRIMMAGIFLTMFGGFGLSRIFMKLFKGGSFDGVALVNGIDISRQTFQTVVAQEDQRLSAIRQQYGKNADLYMEMMGISQDSHVNAFNSVVYAALLDDLVQKMDLIISKEYTQTRIADPRFLIQEFGHILPREILIKDGNIDTFAILDFLKKSGHMSAIEAELQEKLAKEFALALVSSAFFVPSYMIKQMYVEKKLAKKFSYQLFSLDTFLQKERAAGVTTEQLKSFYTEQNKLSKRYWTSEKRTGTVWTFTPDTYGIIVDQSEVDAYYAKNKSTRFIKEPVQIKVREIVLGNVVERGLAVVEEEAQNIRTQLLENPAQFEKLVKDYSTDKDTASKGGLTVWLKRGDKDKEYEKAAFKLKEDGEISPAIRTKDAVVILQRVERKDATFEPLEKVRAEIVKILTDQKFRVEFTRQANLLSRQDDTAVALDQFVKAHKGNMSEIASTQKDMADTAIQRLFALKNKGDISVLIKDGKGLIVQYKDQIAAHVTSFDSIISKVTADYYEEKGTKALEAAVKKAKEQSAIQKKFVSIDGGKISSTDWIKADDEKALEKLIALGFPQGCVELDWVGAIISTFTKDGGIVIRLDEIEELKSESLDQAKAELNKEAFERNRTLFLQGFIASLFRNATIKTNDELSRVKDQL